MQYADNGVVDQSTGEVLARGSHAMSGVPLVPGYGNEGGGMSVDKLQTMLNSALERNAMSDARMSKAYEMITSLKAKVASLQEQVSEKRRHFHQQLAIAQGKFQNIAAKRNSSYSTKKGAQVDISYADLGNMLDEIRPVLTELGISYRQPVLDHPTDHSMATVQTVLACDGYEEIVSSVSFSTTAKLGGDFKELGTAITLIRRYTLGASLGLAIEGKNKEDSNRQRSDHSNRNDSEYRNRSRQQSYNREPESPARPTPQAWPQQDAPAAQTAPAQQASPSQAGAGDIEAQLRSLAFADVVKLFNSLDNEQKKKYKPIFAERRAQHQSQAKGAA